MILTVHAGDQGCLTAFYPAAAGGCGLGADGGVVEYQPRRRQQFREVAGVDPHLSVLVEIDTVAAEHLNRFRRSAVAKHIEISEVEFQDEAGAGQAEAGKVAFFVGEGDAHLDDLERVHIGLDEGVALVRVEEAVMAKRAVDDVGEFGVHGGEREPLGVFTDEIELRLQIVRPYPPDADLFLLRRRHRRLNSDQWRMDGCCRKLRPIGTTLTHKGCGVRRSKRVIFIFIGGEFFRGAVLGVILCLQTLHRRNEQNSTGSHLITLVIDVLSPAHIPLAYLPHADLLIAHLPLTCYEDIAHLIASEGVLNQSYDFSFYCFHWSKLCKFSSNEPPLSRLLATPEPQVGQVATTRRIEASSQGTHGATPPAFAGTLPVLFLIRINLCVLSSLSPISVACSRAPDAPTMHLSVILSPSLRLRPRCSVGNSAPEKGFRRRADRTFHSPLPDEDFGPVRKFKMSDFAVCDRVSVGLQGRSDEVIFEATVRDSSSPLNNSRVVLRELTSLQAKRRGRRALEVLKKLVRRQLMYHSYAMQVHGYVSPSTSEEGDHFILVHGVRFTNPVMRDPIGSPDRTGPRSPHSQPISQEAPSCSHNGSIVGPYQGSYSLRHWLQLSDWFPTLEATLALDEEWVKRIGDDTTGGPDVTRQLRLIRMIMRDLLIGVNYLHSHGLAHTELRLENVHICPVDRHIKLGAWDAYIF
ncbi:hypothetical protein KSP39_PZI015781 [Platanthera zijinensis]|uniref:Protein kinase domain-containing protein n=1 Tax=Platanthera zijinensis TaxID=2320716 RepID=A0AAP0B901_9ASPA